MNCPNCKNPIQENATECEWCGNKLSNKNDSINNISDVDGVVLNMLKQGQAIVKFFCKDCGHVAPKWLGKCPSCEAWNSFTEEVVQKSSALNAVKYKKDNSNLNLKESKDYVDSLALKNGLSSKQGCFIATACYGNYESHEVIEFRKFRDEILLKSFLGRIFVSMYYFVSPPIANLISKSEISKRVIRELFLAPILNLLRKR